MIINGITPSDPKGQILERIIDSLGINLVIVLSHELLYNSLSKKYKNKSSPQIIPLSKSAGVVEMSYEMKQNIIGDEFKEYFEGVQGTLRKYRIKLPLHEYKIYKLESGNIYIYIYNRPNPIRDSTTYWGEWSEHTKSSCKGDQPIYREYPEQDFGLRIYVRGRAIIT